MSVPPERTSHLSTVRLTLVARCADVATALARETTGIRSVTISTADGLLVASTLTGKQEADKMSALSGSIAALAHALTREAGHGGPDRVILESADGQIVSMRVVAENNELVLTVVTDNSALLGKVLWSCRAAADRLSAYRSGLPIVEEARA